MCRPKIWQPRISPFKFTLMILSNSSSVMSKNGVGEFTPAPFTRMSTRPSFARTSPSSFCKPAREVVSHEKNSALPPSFAIFSKRALALASSRPTRAVTAPAAAKPSAIAPHSSPVPPMTTATLSLSENNSAGVFMILFCLALNPRTAAAKGFFNLLARGHRSVARRRRGQRAVGGAIFDGLLGVIEFEETKLQSAGKTVAAADAVQDFQLGIFPTLEKFP